MPRPLDQGDPLAFKQTYQFYQRNLAYFFCLAIEQTGLIEGTTVWHLFIKIVSGLNAIYAPIF